MNEEFFVVPKVVCEHHLNGFFLHTRNFLPTGPGIFDRTDIFFWFDQSPLYMIFWKQGNFNESKLLWAYNGLKFIIEQFFRFCEIRTKADRNVQ